MKKAISFFLLAIFPFLNAIAQDVYLANQYANPIYLNPAYSGGSEGPAAFMNYRNQWPGISGSYTYYLNSIDIPMEKIGGGFGAVIFNEKSARGLINNNSYGLTYAQAFQVSNNISIRIGAQVDYIRRRINWTA